jgi:hypothetical protein
MSFRFGVERATDIGGGEWALVGRVYDGSLSIGRYSCALAEDRVDPAGMPCGDVLIDGVLVEVLWIKMYGRFVDCVGDGLTAELRARLVGRGRLNSVSVPFVLGGVSE